MPSQSCPRSQNYPKEAVLPLHPTLIGAQSIRPRWCFASLPSRMILTSDNCKGNSSMVDIFKFGIGGEIVSILISEEIRSRVAWL